ncbi:MAG: bifunctional glutamate N-acetyltransferase/amino-acid acetyltransferase ArgJ [Candidatus Caenarcaniphilales bacterium]|nr:bifunctional glutamate N-acetyltransferase/amino-acid acetyltransferase ArgJ [Candidatus Caenarcaniphilales bacterium]
MLPKGYLFSGLFCGIKQSKKKDIGLLVSEKPCSWAGVFTTNTVKAHCVVDNQALLQENKPINCLVVNSGNANACTGEAGWNELVKVKKAIALGLNINENAILTASTGVIGQTLPGDLILQALPQLNNNLSSNPEDFAEAILTTDLVTKTAFKDLGEYSIFGVCKGSGMIHPNMATMLAFVITDAKLSNQELQEALQEANNKSFNQITVDGDTSTNDMVLLLANGESGKEPNKEAFQKALTEICQDLAKQIVADGEGANRVFQIKVYGGSSDEECRIMARGIASSMLVKSAIFGADPNWGRIVAAAGQYGQVDADKVSLKIFDTWLIRSGTVCEFNKKELSSQIAASKEVFAELYINEKLHLPTEGIAWGCDLSYDYVRINSEYTT